MASKFTAGMKNVVEVLNQMWDAFAAGPYNALPLTGGNLSGPVTSTDTIRAREIKAGVGVISDSHLVGGASGQASGLTETLRLGVAERAGAAFPGFFSFQTLGGQGTLYKEGQSLTISNYESGSAVFSQPLLRLDGFGRLTAPGMLRVGPVLPTSSENVISGVEQVQGKINLSIPNSAAFYVSAGPAGSAAPCAINVSSNTTTGCSIRAGGTINASGADYAEYLIKSLLCGTIAPGQIVGIDADGRLTDKWDRAIAFMVKSTNPCMVGGDSWAQDLGVRPAASQRAEEDTDDTWAAKELEHASALAAFDIALEQRRQTVDRIAFAGQVPVNVLGATPGQYIVPVQEGEGIAGQAVDRGDMTLNQYMSAIGRVIAIEDDGRARIIVKVA